MQNHNLFNRIKQINIYHKCCGTHNESLWFNESCDHYHENGNLQPSKKLLRQMRKTVFFW